ncbi:MAG: ATP-binding protein [Thermoanaerobaculia bacterium]
MTSREQTGREQWTDANQRWLVHALAEVRNAFEPGAERSPEPAPATPDQPFALERLCAAFGLTPFERSILLLCAGIELDGALAAIYAAAHGDPTRPYPTFSLALATLPGAHWSALAPAGPLRRWQLVEVAQNGPITQAALRIDERVLHYLAGIDEMDERVAALVEPFTGPFDILASDDAAAQRIAGSWTEAARPFAPVQLCGRDFETRRVIAAAAAARAGLALAIIPLEAIPAGGVDLTRFARLWEREAVLTASALLIECGTHEAPPSSADALRQFLTRTVAPLVVSGRERRPLPARVRSVDLGQPSLDEQREVWESALGDAAQSLNGDLDALAVQFPMAPGTIRACAAEVLGERDEEIAQALWRTCRARSRQRLDELAQRIESRAEWADLVLPPRQTAMLRDVVASVRHRALVCERWGFGRRDWRVFGTAALFHGASGTGKTLAAEVLAGELQLDLYRIDLSGVVSKYIGETEKNLRRLFDAAEESGAVLLFDEADALFGKRSEVRDSHDRYANIEVSYLLQRMETYRGLAILTTNMREALDPAFLRRLRFVVDFPFPGLDERLEIWRRTFPPELPTEGIDVSKLAHLIVAGGNIRNIALSAAYLAADERTSVGMRHLLQAARSEYLKLEKALPGSEVDGWL